MLPPHGRRCPRSVTLAFKQRAGLGHRVTNLLMLFAAASAFTLAPAPASDFDNCSQHHWHGCYGGAGSTLGLHTLDMTPVEQLWAHPRTETVNLGWRPPPPQPSQTAVPDNINGLGWGVLAGWGTTEGTRKTKKLSAALAACNTVHRMREAWFRDLSLGRWVLSAAVERAPLPPSVKKLYGAEMQSLVVAVHLRYGTDTEFDRRKVVHDSWLRAVMDAIAHAARARGVPLRFYAFCGGSPFAWLLARNDTTVIGKDAMPSAAEVVRSLSMADILICGPSSLCLVAAWASTRSLSFTAYGRESFGPGRDFNTCPPGIVCVADNGVLSPAALSRLNATLARWQMRRALSCPPIWELPSP